MLSNHHVSADINRIVYHCSRLLNKGSVSFYLSTCAEESWGDGWLVC